jgi:hypothetical protein
MRGKKVAVLLGCLLFLVFSSLSFDCPFLSLRSRFTSIASDLIISGTLCGMNQQARANEYPEGETLALLLPCDSVGSIWDRSEDPSAVSGKKGEKGVADQWDVKDGQN